MRIGVLCHPGGMALWQVEAIERIAENNEIILLLCEPAPPPRRRAQYLGYYALNLACIRNRLTRVIPFPTSKTPVVASMRFHPTFEGAWAVLPDNLLEWVREQRLDAIVKFGLGLLRVPDEKRLPVPILSYHHGDPRSYRGRPAGFHELNQGERSMGQVVQIITNDLDQGVVLAFAQSPVIPHSYRKTLIEAYRLSPHLLPKALEALAGGRRVSLGAHGPNYRLPPNGAVLRFTLARLSKLAARIGYGALVEKKWEVASVPLDGAAGPVAAVASAEERRSLWDVVERLPGYTFYADPFFHSGVCDVLVEALNSRSGKGELVRIVNGRPRRITGFDGHVSYPGTIEEAGALYLVPEISDWSDAAVYQLEGDHARRIAKLDIDAGRLLDPTLARICKRLFLFANRAEDGPSVLHLWSAPSLFGRFEAHPASPIRVSGRGSRMAGELIQIDGSLFRLGQDVRKGYGDGILAFQISNIDELIYCEVPAGEVAFASVRGPHTVSIRDGILLFDYYVEQRTPLAGLRRLLSRR